MVPRTWLAAVMLGGCGPTTESAIESDSTTTGPSCASYLEVSDIGPSVAITVRNLSAGAIFLPATSGCFFTPAIAVATAQGEPVLQPEDPSRLCASIIADADCDPAGYDCGMAGSGRLEPGAEDDAGWSGAQAIAIELVAACAPEPSCPASCLQLEPAAAGMYDVSVTAYRQCTGACTCDGEGPEVCGLYAEHELGEPQTFTTRIDYPAQSTAEITIADG